MPSYALTLDCPIYDSFRVRQVAGMFDLPVGATCAQSFAAELPDLSEPWDIGVIVGPSGSGKTTIARHAYGDAFYRPQPWPADRAVIDCFGERPIKQIVRILTAVGFGSPPSWLKPFDVLSNGEKFRCELARGMLSQLSVVSGQLSVVKSTTDNGPLTTDSVESLIVFDEFTSVVDRTVAKISAAAVSKAIRTGAVPVRFVAVTCHYDIVLWLDPDWVLDMGEPNCKSQIANRKFHWTRRRLRRPPIKLEVFRAPRAAWELFARHHYLSGSLHRSSQCFVGLVENRPAVFTAVLPFPHPRRPGWREHRTVCLPDFQGVGIGSAMSDFVASLFVATGKPYFSRTSHPAMIRHRLNSPRWKMLRQPGMVSRSGMTSRDTTQMGETVSRGRNTAGFEYVGPAFAVQQ